MPDAVPGDAGGGGGGGGEEARGQTALVDRAEKAEALVSGSPRSDRRSAPRRGRRGGALLKARERVEANLTEGAALVAALDDAAAMKEAAHGRSCGDTRRRRKAAKGEGVCAAAKAVQAMLAARPPPPRRSRRARAARKRRRSRRRRKDERGGVSELRAMIGVTASIESQVARARRGGAKARR